MAEWRVRTSGVDCAAILLMVVICSIVGFAFRMGDGGQSDATLAGQEARKSWSIDGLKLGMSTADVERIRGRPNSRWHNTEVPQTTFEEWDWDSPATVVPGVKVVFDDGVAREIAGRRLVTCNGIVLRLGDAESKIPQGGFGFSIGFQDEDRQGTNWFHEHPIATIRTWHHKIADLRLGPDYNLAIPGGFIF